MATLRKWEQLPDESSKAYQAFCYYLKLAPKERSLSNAYQAYVSEKQGGQQKGNGKKAPGRWTDWSRQHQWVERVQAYDAHLQRKELIAVVNQRQKEITAYLESEFLLAQGVQRIVTKKVAAVMKKAPEDLDVAELRQLILTYDTARVWLQQVMGLVDEDADRLGDMAWSDEALAQRRQEGGR